MNQPWYFTQEIDGFYAHTVLIERNKMEKSNKKNNIEISLKEIILALIKNWLVILICTGGALLIAFVYLSAIAAPVYESSIDGTISIPKSIENKYGVYNFPSVERMDYIKEVTSDNVLNKTIASLKWGTTVEDLRSKVSVIPDVSITRFSITAKADSPQNAKTLVTKIAEVFLDELRNTYREYAIASFLKDYDNENSKLTEDLKKGKMNLTLCQEDLLKISPVVTLKKLLSSDPELAKSIAYEHGLLPADLKNDTILLEEFINPNYSEVQKSVWDAEKKVISINVEISRNDSLHTELLAAMEATKKYRESGDSSGLTEKALDVIGSNIQLLDNSSLPASPVLPKKPLTMAIALVFGLMLGVTLALLKYYWNTKKMA